MILTQVCFCLYQWLEALRMLTPRRLSRCPNTTSNQRLWWTNQSWKKVMVIRETLWLGEMCTVHAWTETDADDELTGDREAHMASLLARYRKSLLERTKHHLGNVSLLFLTYSISLFLFILSGFSHNVYIVFLKLGLHCIGNGFN